jgi:DNA invertase Pin-like site-specific DNA recombinase
MDVNAKAIGYVRVSTSSQVQGGEGLGMQEDRIRAWSRFQEIEIVGIEVDAGISGASTDGRPAFRRAVRQALALGHEGTLVVYKLDRLGRSSLDVQETLAVLVDAGVRVRAIASNYEGIPRTRSRYASSHPANRRLL